MPNQLSPEVVRLTSYVVIAQEANWPIGADDEDESFEEIIGDASVAIDTLRILEQRLTRDCGADIRISNSVLSGTIGEVIAEAQRVVALADQKKGS